MLEIKNIRKSFKTADFTQIALDNISIKFRKSEFVSILGPSGSGKTTLLNIIGGLDRYDSGDLVINNKSTKTFKDKDWDAYRNNCIGFVFQNYNLISHISILENVEMGMTLSGVKTKERRKRAKQALEKVGLKDHMNKRPNQLSGGQMQRVAIARALVNNPDIIMADEPTGALDSVTSIQIMDLLKEISKDKLVIMVTHNPELAQKYSTRIIELKDGKLISDSNPVTDDEKEGKQYLIGRTSMGFFQALKLSFTNIMTKKGRTAITAFASSIGIIGIAIILSISSGFKEKIDKYIKDTMDQFPIIVNHSAMISDEDSINTMSETQNELSDIMNKSVEYPDTKEAVAYDSSMEKLVHINNITDEYKNYIESIDNSICSSVGYITIGNLNLFRKDGGKVSPISVSAGVNSELSSGTSGLTSMNCTTYPTMLDKNKNYLEEYYDVLDGRYPENKNEIVIVVDQKNRIDVNVLKALGCDVKKDEVIPFGDLLKLKIKFIPNNNYYKESLFDMYTFNTDYEKVYNMDNNIELKVVGIVRGKSDVTISLLATGIAYSNELAEEIYENNKDSEIVKAQQNLNYNILTREEFKDENSKEQILSYLGGNDTPYAVLMYPTTFDNKTKLLEYLDEFNNGKSKDEKVVYTDLSETITSMTNGIMDAITVVLVAFSAISLVVSSIMIGIITYISVLERTKEIGILRAIGARKKDITRVFNAETFIIGLISGGLGLIIAYLLTFPINKVLYKLTELENVACLKATHCIVLLLISIILTLIGGFIPAKLAAKKDPVEALRTE